MKDGSVLLDVPPEGEGAAGPAGDIRLTLPANPRNLALVRHVVGVAHAVEFGAAGGTAAAG